MIMCDMSLTIINSQNEVWIQYTRVLRPAPELSHLPEISYSIQAWYFNPLGGRNSGITGTPKMSISPADFMNSWNASHLK